MVATATAKPGTQTAAESPAGEAATPNASATSAGASVCVAEAPEAAPLSAPAADPMANVRPRCPEGRLFEHGTIHLETNALHTVHALSVDLPVNRLTAVTGVSGSSKTTLVLEELIPALNSANADETLPASVRGIDPPASSRAAHRCNSHQCERTLDRRHLLRRARRPAPRVRSHQRGKKPRA